MFPKLPGCASDYSWFSARIVGWHNTHNKLELYIANDTKYRYLKLEAGAVLKKWMGFVDSPYSSDGKMRDSIIGKEEQNQLDFEMMQKAKQIEDEQGS